MDQSEDKSPRRAKGPDGFCPSRREAVRREQAKRDKGTEKELLNRYESE